MSSAPPCSHRCKSNLINECYAAWEVHRVHGLDKTAAIAGLLQLASVMAISDQMTDPDMFADGARLAFNAVLASLRRSCES